MKALVELQTKITTIETFQCTETAAMAQEIAFKAAQQHTQREKLLILSDNNYFNPYEDINNEAVVEIIQAGDTATLCKAIANSSERIAAIIVKHTQASPYYYKKVRELSSAEGAVMIWDALNQTCNQATLFNKISKNSQPDIICFSVLQTETTIWIGGKKTILQGGEHVYTY